VISEPSFFACIDESGDQGFSFGTQNSSSPWFVLAAVVGLAVNTPELSTRVLQLKKEIGWNPSKHLHFKDVKSDRRDVVIQRTVECRDHIRSIVVMFHKPSLANPEAFSENNRLYFYSTRFLLERISWLCRDSREHQSKTHGDGTCRLIFSRMNEVSRLSLVGYLERLRNTESTVYWPAFRQDRLEAMSPSKHVGLQLADVVAHSFYCADHPNEKRRAHSWAETLKPIMHRGRNGAYRGSGVKIFPAFAENQITQGTLCPWVTSAYPK